MTYETMPYTPASVGYSVSYDASPIRTDIEDVALGFYDIRQRKDRFTLNITWKLSLEELIVFMAFYKTCRAGKPFLGDLVLDEGEPKSCRCFFVPKSMSYSVSSPNVFMVSATVQAMGAK